MLIETSASAVVPSVQESLHPVGVLQHCSFICVLRKTFHYVDYIQPSGPDQTRITHGLVRNSKADTCSLSFDMKDCRLARLATWDGQEVVHAFETTTGGLCHSLLLNRTYALSRVNSLRLVCTTLDCFKKVVNDAMQRYVLS